NARQGRYPDPEKQPMHVLDESPAGQDSARVLRSIPEFRRCAVYLAIGCLLGAGMQVGLDGTENLPRPWPGIGLILFVLGSQVLAFAYVGCGGSGSGRPSWPGSSS